MLLTIQRVMDFNKVIAGTLYYVIESRAALIRALAWPFVVFVLMDATEYLEVEEVIASLIGVVNIGAQTVFAITTHRVVLLGPGSVSKWGITSWTKRETFFALHVIGLALMAIPIMLLSFIPILGGIVALIVICWFAGRFCLVFPGIAIDKGVSFKLSWEFTERHQTLMFLVVIAFPILLAVPTIILSFVPYTFFLSSLVSTFVIVFEVAALSMAYQLITAEAYENG